MGLIRRADAGTMVRDAVVLDLGDLSRQGEEILSRSRQQAQQIVAEAHRERERLIADAAEVGRKAGHAEGHAQGRIEGREAALEADAEEISRLVGVWEEAAVRFEAQRDRLMGELRTDVLRLALAIAERVVKRVVEIDEGLAAREVESALELVAANSRAVVAVHPDDRTNVEGIVGGILRRFGRAGHVEVVEDETVTRGGCVIRSARGSVDARVETQLERIAQAVLGQSRDAEPAS
ncbi:MAG: FliH/SctL family protein [Phycisphaerales bacterium]